MPMPGHAEARRSTLREELLTNARQTRGAYMTSVESQQNTGKPTSLTTNTNNAPQITHARIHGDMSIDTTGKNDGPSGAHIHAHTRHRVHKPAGTRKTLHGHAPGRTSLDRFTHRMLMLTHIHRPRRLPTCETFRAGCHHIDRGEIKL